MRALNWCGLYAGDVAMIETSPAGGARRYLAMTNP